MRRPSADRLLMFALGAVALAAFLGVQWRLIAYAPDDAFISLRYAQHLAQGHGLVYNLGERVEGYTNFLWTVLLALPFVLHVNPVLFMKLASAALGLSSALLLWRLGLTSQLVPDARDSGSAPAEAAGTASRPRRSRPAPAAPPARWPQSALAAVPALLFLATPAVAISAAEGLETMLFVFLTLLSLTWFCAERDAGSFPHSALASAALAMTRPDGAPLGLLLLVSAWMLRRPRRYWLAFALIFLGSTGAYQLARFLYYGQPFPNTLYAKGGGDLALAARGWAGFVRFAIACDAWAWVAALPAFLARRTRAAALVLAAAALLRVAFQIWSGGPWQGQDRFLVPVLPLADLLVVAGLAVLLRSPRARAATLVPAAAMLLLPGWLSYPHAERSCLGYSQALLRAHIPLGVEIRARTAPDAVIAMDDAGIGPLLSERTNIDMLGLNDEHIGHLPGRFLEKYDTRYVLSRRPDLVVLLALVPEPRTGADFRLPGHAALYRDPEFQARYVLARRYVFGWNYHLLVFRRADSRAVPANF